MKILNTRFGACAMTVNRENEHGPFDIIGDVHGCFLELKQLLKRLGYEIAEIDTVEKAFSVSAPPGRKVIFLGDLVDRGPNVPSVLGLAMSMVAAGSALCVPGNHDVKLVKKLKGRDVKISHGLAESLEQLERYSDEFRQRVIEFFDNLDSHLILDDGKLVVAHAGIKESLIGKSSSRVTSFTLYGDTNGETDDYGFPVRLDWVSRYQGEALVVFGHTPIREPRRINRTICIDTGCVFGGKLTAFRYPEDELVAVPAQRTYFDYLKPLQ